MKSSPIVSVIMPVTLLVVSIQSSQMRVSLQRICPLSQHLIITKTSQIRVSEVAEPIIRNMVIHSQKILLMPRVSEVFSQPIFRLLSPISSSLVRTILLQIGILIELRRKRIQEFSIPMVTITISMHQILPSISRQALLVLVRKQS